MYIGYERTRKTCFPTKIIDNEDGFIHFTLLLDNIFESYCTLHLEKEMATHSNTLA